MESKVINLPTTPARGHQGKETCGSAAEYGQQRGMNSSNNRPSNGIGSIGSAFLARPSDAIEMVLPQQRQSSSSPVEVDVFFSDKYHAHKDNHPNEILNGLPLDRCINRSSTIAPVGLRGYGDDRINPYEREWQMRLLQIQSIAASREQSLKAQRSQLQVQIELAAVREAMLEARLRSIRHIRYPFSSICACGICHKS